MSTRTRLADEFHRVREAYRLARTEERIKIIRRLNIAGYSGISPNAGTPRTLTAHGGQGRFEYTNDKQLSPPHDLRNWLWIDARRADGTAVRVMLQSFDQDTHTRNEHVLFDRISIGVIPEQIRDSRWLLATELELPLDEAGLDQLVALLDAAH